MPDIISDFKQAFPAVQLRISSAPSPELIKMVLQNRLDLIVANSTEKMRHTLATREVLREKIYFVISDAMLEEYLPEHYPSAKRSFGRGWICACFSRCPWP